MNKLNKKQQQMWKKMRNDAQTKEILRVPPLSFILCELVLSFRSSSSTVSISLCTVKNCCCCCQTSSLSLCSFHFILFIIGFDCLQKEKWEKNRSFYSNKSVFSVRTFIRPNVFSAHASTTTTTTTTMRGRGMDNKWIKNN